MEDLFRDKTFISVKKLLEDPNIFDILKIDSAEIRHTNLIQWLLTINNYCGLKKLLNCIFEGKINIDDIDYNSINYYNDRPFNQIFDKSKNKQRPDLLIKYKYKDNKDNKDNHYILIENKVNSYENDNQTKDYKTEMEKCGVKKENVFYVYLDVKGEKAECDDYFNLNYDTFYKKILKYIRPNEKEKEIYEQYINSLKRPKFDKNDILTDDIYVVDEDDISKYKELYEKYKDNIKKYKKKNDDDYDYYAIKYIIYCIKDKIDEKIVNKILGNERKKYKWSYKGIYYKNIELIKRLCVDLMENKDEESLDKLKRIKAHGDKLLVDDLDEVLKDKGWEKYLKKHTDENIEDFYYKIHNQELYVRNCIGYETMEEVEKLFKDKIKKESYNK